MLTRRPNGQLHRQYKYRRKQIHQLKKRAKPMRRQNVIITIKFNLK
jgi:hypothetical protein